MNARTVRAHPSSLAAIARMVVALGLLLPAISCDERRGPATGAAPAVPVTAAAAPATPAVLLRYEVGGMHCSGCSEAIKDKVMAIAGVRSAEVDHEHGRASIGADSESVDPQIRAAVERLGYTIKRQA